MIGFIFYILIMAILKLGAFASKISGKINGMVTGTSNGVSYIKSNSYSQNKKTTSQLKQQSKIGLVTQIWRNLSTEQRESWAVETPNYPYINRVGETVFYNGFQLFCKLNLNLQVIGQNTIGDAPVYTNIDLPNGFIALSPADTIIQTWSQGITGSTISIYCSPQKTNLLFPKNSEYRLVKTFVLPNTNGAVGIELEYEAIFGTITPNLYIFSKFKAYDTASGNVTDFSLPTNILTV